MTPLLEIPDLPAVLRGDIDFTVLATTFGLPQVQSGKFRALAVTSGKRMRVLPDVPTTREVLKQDLLVQDNWSGIAMHARTPVEFIRRINGLDSIDEVFKVVFDASYLVLGLGDVYLGAPVATPVDPRHRLVTTKYNPARTWTPENAVGIGGAYMCVYGMEGPGGYQFVGRTLQMWNRWRHGEKTRRRTISSTAMNPTLCRCPA